MEEQKIGEEVVVTPAAEEQDPLKTELERVQRTGKTELEKAQFSLKKNAERLKELGGDPTAILGIEKELPTDEDDKPVTLGMWKKLQQESASKSAVQLAEEISNETERELTKYHLQNSIKSTGNPTEDLRLARTLTNAARNGKVIEEMGRRTEPKSYSNGSGVDAKNDTIQGDLTLQEKAFLKILPKEQILKLRQK